MNKPKIPFILFVGTLCLLGFATYWAHFAPSQALEPESYPSPSPSPPPLSTNNSIPEPAATNIVATDTNSIPEAVATNAPAAATSYEPEPTSAAPAAFDAKVIMRIFVSLAVLASALFVILWKKYDANDKKWAYGSVGAILGYWLGGG